jgi:hypothetical protein
LNDPALADWTLPQRGSRLDIYAALHNMRAVPVMKLHLTLRTRNLGLSGSSTKAARFVSKGTQMIQQFETIQKASKDNVDAALKAFGATSKGVQTIATEATDYAKKSFEAGTAAIEKLSGVKTLDKAIEIQADYIKTAFEGAVAQMTKMGELYTALAKDVYKPFEGIVAKATPAAK